MTLIQFIILYCVVGLIVTTYRVYKLDTEDIKYMKEIVTETEIETGCVVNKRVWFYLITFVTFLFWPVLGFAKSSNKQ